MKKLVTSFDTKLLEPQLLKQQLLTAIKDDDVETIKLLLTPNNINDFGEISLLHWAVRNRELEMARLLLDQGMSPEIVSSDRNTPLHLAAYQGNLVMVQLLLDYGANPEAINQNQYSVLHLAALQGHIEVVQLLLDHEANLEAIDNEHETALHLAVQQGHLEVVQLLLDYEANLMAVNNDQQTVLHWAAAIGYVRVVQLLSDRGVNLAAVDRYNDTALHWAAKWGRTKIVQLLLDHGANLGAVDHQQQTALESMSKPCVLRTIQPAPYHQIISTVVLTGLQATFAIDLEPASLSSYQLKLLRLTQLLDPQYFLGEPCFAKAMNYINRHYLELIGVCHSLEIGHPLQALSDHQGCMSNILQELGSDNLSMLGLLQLEVIGANDLALQANDHVMLSY